MKEVIKKFFVVTFIALVSAQANASDSQVPITIDSRIRTLIYNENEVYRLVIHYGYQTSVEFAKGEEIQTISVGNSYAWQLSPVGRRLFIKPLEDSIRTNMTIITNRHAYQFDIQSKPSTYGPDDELAYVVRFLYPKENQDEFHASSAKPRLLPQIQPYNFNYELSGEEGLKPIKVFDDGSRTYFEFKEQGLSPKIAAITNDKEQNLKIYRQGKYIVVNELAHRFAIINGKQKVTVVNNNK